MADDAAESLGTRSAAEAGEAAIPNKPAPSIANEALRTNEGAYRHYVARKNLSDDELLQIMAEYPELLQRPIVVLENKAVLARPVDKLRELGIK